MNDVLADTLARLSNATERLKKTTVVINTKLNKNVLDVLKQENFIKDYEVLSDREIEVELAFYDEDGEVPMVENFVKVSKSGQRIYIRAEEIFPVLNGRGISIITTSKGVMTGAQAKAMGVGGEYICKVW